MRNIIPFSTRYGPALSKETVQKAAEIICLWKLNRSGLPEQEVNLGHDPRHDERTTEGPGCTVASDRVAPFRPARRAPIAHQHPEAHPASRIRSGE